MNSLNVGGSFQQKHEKASKKALGILNKLLHETQWFECPVCLELLQDVHVIPECMHRFCHSCITKSLDKCGRECPSCRCRIVGKRGLRKDVVMEGILQQIASAAKVLDDACNMHEIIDIMDSESDDDSIVEMEDLATCKRVPIEDSCIDENDTNVDKGIDSDSIPSRKRKLEKKSDSDENYDYSSHDENGKPYANDHSMEETETPKFLDNDFFRAYICRLKLYFQTYGTDKLDANLDPQLYYMYGKITQDRFLKTKEQLDMLEELNQYREQLSLSKKVEHSGATLHRIEPFSQKEPYITNMNQVGDTNLKFSSEAIMGGIGMEPIRAVATEEAHHNNDNEHQKQSLLASIRQGTDVEFNNVSTKDSNGMKTNHPKFWTEEEDAKLYSIVSPLKGEIGIRWADIQRYYFPGRSSKSIRDRWVNHLNPNLTNLPFDDDDDKKLWEAYKKYGKKWVLLSSKCFDSTRSENELKNRFNGRTFQKFVSEHFGPNEYPKKESKVKWKLIKKVDNDK
ncbi:hypothetical protein CTEN210_05625 [Chaetoceros tenuissimus]|uniref:RING-type E3 ubiquitin transferase n=2 Tax=Chaetoceros tenuissimus TaxID=426638 RepID=A0AAD3CNX1_9STRA|nr:hypothetical protein CTEN210_05625 [Chaetoceros tenuissimus]